MINLLNMMVCAIFGHNTVIHKISSSQYMDECRLCGKIGYGPLSVAEQRKSNSLLEFPRR